MVAISRRALLALGASVCFPGRGIAASIEPILRNPGVLIASLSVTWVHEDPRWPAVAGALSSYVETILREEVHKANLPLSVGGQPLVMLGDPYSHSPLYAKVGLKLEAVPGPKPVMGTVGLRLERLGFEAVDLMHPGTRFLATNDELSNRSAQAIREKLVVLIDILAKEDERKPTL